jgi:hypothetical protein
MEYTLTKEEIPQLPGVELLQYLYSTECSIHSIQFSLTYDGIIDGTYMYEGMVSELAKLKELHEDLMDEVMIRKERE